MQTVFRIIIDGKKDDAVSDEILLSQLERLFPNKASQIKAWLSTGPVPLKKTFDKLTAVKIHHFFNGFDPLEGLIQGRF